MLNDFKWMLKFNIDLTTVLLVDAKSFWLVEFPIKYPRSKLLLLLMITPIKSPRSKLLLLLLITPIKYPRSKLLLLLMIPPSSIPRANCSF